MTHSNDSKTGSLATLILLGSVSLAQDCIERVCSAAVIRPGNETVEGTVNGFAAHLESKLAL